MVVVPARQSTSSTILTSHSTQSRADGASTRFEVAEPRARSLISPCADWTHDSHNDAVHIFGTTASRKLFRRM